MATRNSKKRKADQVDLADTGQAVLTNPKSSKTLKINENRPPEIPISESNTDQNLVLNVPERPSDGWNPDFALNSPEVKEIITAGNWDYLCAETLKHHPSPKDLTCSIDLSCPVRGMNNVVFEIAFSDSTYWVARVCLGETERTERDMLCEIATMRLVQQRTSLPIPTVFSFACDSKYPFGFPYMLMNALPGKKLPRRFGESVPKYHRNKVASQLARVIHELSRITFDTIGRIWCGHKLDKDPQIISLRKAGLCNGEYEEMNVGPFKSSHSYFHTRRKSSNAAFKADHSTDADWPKYSKACKALQDSISSIHLKKYNRGPFPLYHMDLQFNNILLDNDFNFTGVMDWEYAFTAPVEQSAKYYDLMIYNKLSDEQNLPLREFRDLTTHALRALEADSHAESTLAISELTSSKTPQIIHWCIPRTYPVQPEAFVVRAENSLEIQYGKEATLDNYKLLRHKMTESVGEKPSAQQRYNLRSRRSAV